MDTNLRHSSAFDNIANLSTSIFTSSPVSLKSKKLKAITDRQKAKLHLQIMRNRVQKLLKEKEKAEKEIIITKNQTKILKQRLRNKNREALDKMLYYKNKKEHEQQMREKFAFERLVRKSNKEKFERLILEEKRQIVYEKKEKSRELDGLRYFNRNNDLEEKQSVRKEVYQGYVKALKNRCSSQHSDYCRSQDEYINSIEEEKRIQTDALAKIAELEKVEQNLIGELSKTLQIKSNLVENFNKIKSSYKPIIN